MVLKYSGIGCRYPLLFTVAFCVICLVETACKEPEQKPTYKKVDYIKKIEGPSDSIPVLVAQRGEVLIAYSDCYECHTKEVRSKGPAFSDIAKRYPVQNGYIKLLGLKIINGGSGAWGKSVMLPHPKVSQEDAETMAKYILSLNKAR